MFKFLRRTLCVVIIAAAIVAYVVVTRGGKPFRWFGSRAETTLEHAGQELKRLSQTAAEKADRVHEGTREAREAVDKLRNVQESILTPEKTNDPSRKAAAQEQRP